MRGPISLRLFQHTFGTHPEQPLPTGQQAIYRDSFHSWRFRGMARGVFWVCAVIFLKFPETSGFLVVRGHTTWSSPISNSLREVQQAPELIYHNGCSHWMVGWWPGIQQEKRSGLETWSGQHCPSNPWNKNKILGKNANLETFHFFQGFLLENISKKCVVFMEFFKKSLCLCRHWRCGFQCLHHTPGKVTKRAWRSLKHKGAGSVDSLGSHQ